jgi:hypothetical protein
MGVELVFEIRDAEERGYCARALGHGIFTEAETWNELRENVLEAVSLHFEDAAIRPRMSNCIMLGRTDSHRSRMKLPRGISADRLIRA